MIRFAGAVAVVLLGLAAFSFGRKEETLQELVARAEASKPDQQANRWEEFGTDLQDVVNYCDKAHGAAISSNKHIKNTEIRIRRISSHLKDIKLDVEVDDQPKVQAAIDQLEQFRTDLMRKMFGGKSND